MIGLLAGLAASTVAMAGLPSGAAKGCGAGPALPLDPSGHRISFVTVAPGVRLEVFDWGGKGDALVLLAGLGDNAHVFDHFASQFTDRFHVIGITRRGFGRSSQPAYGYDIGTRARDDIAVLDHLGLRQAIFVGHSVAGTELSRLAAAYPSRVKKLVYLDALDLGSDGWARLPQPPPAPELTEADLVSLQRLAAADERDDGYRKPLAALANAVRTLPSGRIIGAVTPSEISQKIIAGLEPADYARIKVPVLGILNRITPRYRLPYYGDLNPAQRVEYDKSLLSLSRWVDRAITRFRTGLKQALVVELEDHNHYVFIVDEALVVREMRRFLLDE